MAKRGVAIWLGVLLSALTTAASAGASGWTQASPATPPGAVAAQLASVSCTSPRACTAVGYYLTTTTGQQTLAERWDGTSWSVQPTPSPSVLANGGGFVSLTGVSCSRPRACVAVGYVGTVPIIERWQGTWQLQSGPPTGNGALSAVSCARPRACTAVGSETDGQSLAEHWNGIAWTVQPTPNPGPVTALTGVSCPDAGTCTAVGSTSTAGPNSVSTALAERWTGGPWRVLNLPSVPGATDTSFDGLSCPVAQACIAVGQAGPSVGGPFTTLAERGRGRVWTVQATPSPPMSSGSLLAVSCPLRRTCTATGDPTPSGGPLAERLTGSTWGIQPTPGGLFLPYLDGVSCPTSRFCVAVGSSGFRNFGGALIDIWTP